MSRCPSSSDCANRSRTSNVERQGATTKLSPSISRVGAPDQPPSDLKPKTRDLRGVPLSNGLDLCPYERCAGSKRHDGGSSSMIQSTVRRRRVFSSNFFCSDANKSFALLGSRSCTSLHRLVDVLVSTVVVLLAAVKGA